MQVYLVSLMPRILIGALVFTCMACMLGLYSSKRAQLSIRRQALLLAVSLLAGMALFAAGGIARGVALPGMAIAFILMLFVRVVRLKGATTTIHSNS